MAFLEYRGFNHFLPKGANPEKYLASLKVNHLKEIKSYMGCQLEDAKKRGAVTVLIRSKGIWSGNTYVKSGLIVIISVGLHRVKAEIISMVLDDLTRDISYSVYPLCNPVHFGVKRSVVVSIDEIIGFGE